MSKKIYDRILNNYIKKGKEIVNNSLSNKLLCLELNITDYDKFINEIQYYVSYDKYKLLKIALKNKKVYERVSYKIKEVNDGDCVAIEDYIHLLT